MIINYEAKSSKSLNSMRALILSAGYGTRLRPLTNDRPKCLIEIGGKPMLEHWLDDLEKINCQKALVNTHYLAEQVQSFISNRPPGLMELSSVYEDQLLGTAGTLLQSENFFRGSVGLLIHADNATSNILPELINAHKYRPPECLMTMLTFTTSNPESCGIVELDSNGVVIGFHEKDKNYRGGDRANGAVYVFEESLFKEIKMLGPNISDLSTQVLPRLTGKIHTWHTTRPYIDIGTPQSLLKAQKLWQNGRESRQSS